MAISVHVPVRIRLDARSVTGRPEAVTDALGAALARALERSRREVVAPRGGYLEVRAAAPEFRWTGAGGERVSPDDRRAFEARLRQRIDEVVAAARLDPGLPAGVAAPLSRPAVELFDPQRLRSLLAVYRVPSYDDAGDAAEVPVDGDEPPPMRYEWRLRPVTYLIGHFDELAREAVRQHGALSSGSPAGVIARVTGPDGRRVWLVIVATTPLSYLTFDRFGETVFRATPRPHFQIVPRTPSPQPGTVDRRLVADRAALVSMVDEELGADIRTRLRTAQPRGGTTTAEEYAAQIERAVDAEVNRRVQGILDSLGGATPTSLVIVQVGGTSLLLIGTEATDKTLHWTGRANCCRSPSQSAKRDRSTPTLRPVPAPTRAAAPTAAPTPVPTAARAPGPAQPREPARVTVAAPAPAPAPAPVTGAAPALEPAIRHEAGSSSTRAPRARRRAPPRAGFRLSPVSGRRYRRADRSTVNSTSTRWARTPTVCVA